MNDIVRIIIGSTKKIEITASPMSELSFAYFFQLNSLHPKNWFTLSSRYLDTSPPLVMVEA